MLKKITLTIIFLLSALTLFFLIKGDTKYAITFGFIDLTVIVLQLVLKTIDKYT